MSVKLPAGSANTKGWPWTVATADSPCASTGASLTLATVRAKTVLALAPLLL